MCDVGIQGPGSLNKSNSKGCAGGVFSATGVPPSWFCCDLTLHVVLILVCVSPLELLQAEALVLALQRS